MAIAGASLQWLLHNYCDFTARNSAADIHFSPDGKFLYASNRGHESLVIYKVDTKNGKLSLVGHENTGGKHPRIDCGPISFVSDLKNPDSTQAISPENFLYDFKEGASFHITSHAVWVPNDK